MTRLFEYTISKCGSQKGAKEELDGTPTNLFLGVQAADDPVAGERRTESVSDQPGSSRDAQFVVCVVAALSRARGGGFCAHSGLSQSTGSRSTAPRTGTDRLSRAAVSEAGRGTRSAE